ncbi:2-amino-4-hydroxy-6-hydroxymethyldihydropteridine diphosphokinase [Patescibacteria group bacterium]|nr:2-amino-4-hydroxy-6-hydroxymethyldihydropteridine diphosphokinase [Patescibacteria group bacterium]
MRIFLALGSNLGDREANLITAKDLLMKKDVLVVGQSDVRETKPLGQKNQPDYLNQVVEVRSSLGPMELLQVCKEVEAEMGRPGARVGNVKFGEEKWESRVIDVDILFYGDKEIRTAELTIPHPGALERDFILEGMKDLDEEFISSRIMGS